MALQVYKCFVFKRKKWHMVSIHLIMTTQHLNTRESLYTYGKTKSHNHGLKCKANIKTNGGDA